MENLSDSPLLQKIQDAVNTCADKRSGIRISITKNIQEVVDKTTGEIAFTKALCWNLVDSKNRYLTEPVLAVVGGNITEEMLRADLNKFFPGQKSIVDNDIYIDDE